MGKREKDGGESSKKSLRSFMLSSLARTGATAADESELCSAAMAAGLLGHKKKKKKAAIAFLLRNGEIGGEVQLTQ